MFLHCLLSFGFYFPRVISNNYATGNFQCKTMSSNHCIEIHSAHLLDAPYKRVQMKLNAFGRFVQLVNIC